MFCSKQCKNEHHSNSMSGRLSHRKGKTLEEICGVEKAKFLKQYLSKKYSGKGNPNYGGKFYGNRKKCIESKTQRIFLNGHTKKELALYERTSKRMAISNPTRSSLVVDKIIQSRSKSNNYVYKQG